MLLFLTPNKQFIQNWPLLLLNQFSNSHLHYIHITTNSNCPILLPDNCNGLCLLFPLLISFQTELREIILKYNIKHAIAER